ncbi:hypothetical protein [Arthrobacter mangrovi]|nr:hypothetical protein [Arthrobacter mangrovi]
MAATAGRVFARAFAAVKTLRPDRPIHPVGLHLRGRLEREGGPFRSGIAWLDTAGNHEAEARLSRSIGFPPGWPDIIGLAVRLTADSAPVDILLASTGMSRAGRYVLRMCRSVGPAALTTMMPYEGTGGPVQLAARTLRPHGRLPADPHGFRDALGGGEWVLGLYHGRPGAPWQRCGTLTLLASAEAADTSMRFDPMQHPIPGAGTYSWTQALREPSYAVARRPPEKESHRPTDQERGGP